MRILVVEDERKMAGLLKRGLEEEGYSVDLARDGDYRQQPMNLRVGAGLMNESSMTTSRSEEP